MKHQYVNKRQLLKAIMKKVFVNGYGSIGSRIAKFVKEDSDIDVIGIGKHLSLIHI